MAVVACVRTLKHRGVRLGDIGIVTFYSGMRQALQQVLASEVGSGLAVNTVDGFQVRALPSAPAGPGVLCWNSTPHPTPPWLSITLCLSSAYARIVALLA